jgi:tetratricopeptide (TPR) repeat protein
VIFVLPDKLREISAESSPAEKAMPTRAPETEAPQHRTSGREPAVPQIPALPPLAAQERASQAPAPVRESAPPSSAPAVRVDPVKSEAEQLLAQLLTSQARLESGGVKTWGMSKLGTSYGEALGVLDEATKHFDRQRYTPAVEGFRKVIAFFDQLEASKDDRYRRAMEAGNAALTALDSGGASDQFAVALSLRPGDASASAGLVRARALPQVIAHMSEAKRHEDAGDLDTALREYRAAAQLDGAFEPAKRGAERLRGMVESRDYRKAISSALAALDARRFDAAMRALSAARKLRPGAPEIADIAKRTQEERQIAIITELRAQAVTLESREEWAKAVTTYDKILKIDRTVGFAADGRMRAAKFSALHNQITFYLDKPARLSSPEPLAHARQVIASADAVAGAGPRLKGARDLLRELIAKVEAPRPVVLKSDGSTEVTVYRVARFGAFTERQISLRPGKYTAVGSRTGYRDVRVEFEVSSSDEETLIVVSCSERI